MRTLNTLFLAFLLVPILEIYLLIRVGGVIGALPTVALVVGSTLLGGLLVRQQGLATLGRAQRLMAQGQPPALAMLEGLALLVAGFLLLLPGFLTDLLGLVLLVPPLRRGLLRWWLRHALMVQVVASPGSGPRTYEGEARRDDDPRLR